jgi:signal transduction histidine kinase
MIGAAKDVAKRYWPALRLRTILLGTLLLTAALPGFGALFLRVYENTLVRQTEAELIAQGATLVAAAQAMAGAVPTAPPAADKYRAEASTLDLGSMTVLPERPAARAAGAPDPAMVAIGARLAPVAAATARTTLAAIQLIDARGTIIFGHEAGGSYAAVPEVAAALNGNVETIFRRNGNYSPHYAFEWLSRASDLRLHHVRPIVVNGNVIGAILVSRSPRALFRGLYEDRIKILTGIVLIFATLLVLTALLSRGIAKPIAALGRATRAVAAGSGDIPQAPVTAAIEIRELFDNFAIMAAAIERRSHYLRDFAASVSHEFKTPLAGISGTIELLQDHGATMDAGQRTIFLNNMAGDAERLSVLVKRLLDLARADMARPETGIATDLMAALRPIADAFASAAFAVTITTDAVTPPVAMPRATIEAVFNSLIENARQAGGRHVTITVVPDGNGVAVTVTDDGPGVAPADRTRLFEPFFTTRRDNGGTGLGLAIARSLLRASGGDVALIDTPAGAAFVVTAPSGPPRLT